MKSINVILNGGLGNQLFQYAYGRKLSLQYGIDLLLDISLFTQDIAYSRKYSLSQYTLQKNIRLTNDKRYADCYWNLFKLSHRRLFPQYLFDRIGIFEYNPRDSKPRALSSFFDKTPLVGYWQNSALFADIRDTLIEDLTPKQSMSDENETIRKVIEGSDDAVSLHLRCNRNHKIKTYSKHHESSFSPINKYSFNLNKNYYISALNQIKKLTEKFQVYVFSDNIEWSRNLLNELDFNFVYLKENRGADWEDIQLMSKCKHHIIGNSSFSWWGAWLSINEGVKISPYNIPYTPLVPLNWTPFYVKN